MSLPGVNTTILDRFYTISRTDIPVGPRVLAIAKRSNTFNGTTVTVPDLTPYNASREDTVIAQFGDGSQVHRAYLELVAGGAQQVTVVALPSDTTFNQTNATISSTSFTSSSGGGDLWTELWGAVEAASPDIVVPWGRGSHPSDWETPATPGNDQLDYFYADNSSTKSNSWAWKVAEAAAAITADSNPCIAVLGVKPNLTPVTDAVTPTQTSTWLAFPNLVSRSTIGNNGIFLSVVATEVKPVRYPDEYGYANGATTYAGHIAQLQEWSSPTGKGVVATEKMRFNPTRTQQQALVTKGVVPVAVDFNNVPRWVDSMTFSKDTSDYTRLTTVRIVFAAVQVVRFAAQRFIGEGSTLALRNALDTAITSGLRGMQQKGALLASDFEINYVPRENKAIVDLILTPAFELRNIEVRVSVNL